MTHFIGIDLGTTNCAVAFAPLSGRVELFAIPQLVLENIVQASPLLPSACFLSGYEGRKLFSWENEQSPIIGSLAVTLGDKVPTKQIVSAKSWLSTNRGVRGEELLPIDGDALRYSPRQVLSFILQHIRSAWNESHPESILEEQNVVVTIPASFNERARAEVAQSIEKGGIYKFTLLEEPIAALYAWMGVKENAKSIKTGDSILVVDIGGGTTDFALIHVDDDHLNRVAVGKHLILGGDNIDAFVSNQIGYKGPFGASSCKQLKIQAFQNDAPSTLSATIQKRGASVIAQGQVFQIKKEALRDDILDGFFPKVSFDEEIIKNQAIASFGLPYERDCRITAHLAAFLRQATKSEGARYPNKVLFNGGSLKPKEFRSRLLEQISAWSGSEVLELEATSLDFAVAYGAVYSQLSSSRKIHLGLAKTLYIQLQGNKLCTILPRGSEAGVEHEVKKELLLQVNQPVSFPLYSSQVRLHDKVGEIIEPNEDEISQVSTLVSALKYGSQAKSVPIHLRAMLSPIGTVEVSLKGPKVWTLEFETHDHSKQAIRKDELLSEDVKQSITPLIDRLIHENCSLSIIEEKLQKPKEEWTSSLLRFIADLLLKNDKPISWRIWQLLGFTLRPGIGAPGDEWRLKQLWKKVLLQKSTTPEIQLHMLIALRRVAAGLTLGQQAQVLSGHILPLFINPGVLADPKKVGKALYEEKIRAASSFEHLNFGFKETLFKALSKKLRTNNYTTVDFWGWARLLSRLKLYAPLSTALPLSIVEFDAALVFQSLPESFIDAHLDTAAMALAPCGIANLDLKVDSIFPEKLSTIRQQINYRIESNKKKEVHFELLGDLPVHGLKITGALIEDSLG